MKTFSARVPALFDRIRALHTYQVPEILAVPITAVAPTYHQWMVQSVRDS
jgi:periplasmic divalent cation tolerance protein